MVNSINDKTHNVDTRKDLEDATGDDALENAVKTKPEDDDELRVYLFHHVDKIQRPFVGRAVGRLGLHLRVEIDCGESGVWPFLISADACPDRKKFGELWKRFGGGSLQLTWEDGTPFDFV